MSVKLRLKAITGLIGELNSEAIIATYGMSQVGKTTLWLQMLYDISDQTGKPALAYDCEGGMQEFVKQWDAKFKKLYPKAQVDVRVKRDYKGILKDHGLIVKVKYSGADAKSDAAKRNTSGKMALTLVDEIDSEIEKLVVEKKYCAIMYDSITMPMKFFGSEQQNFPARSYAQTLWFQKMLDLIDDHGTYIIANHHASKNPANQYETEKMSGGGNVQYFCKVIIYIKKVEAKGARAYRWIKLARYFSKPPNEHETLVKLTDDGYIDVSEEDKEADIVAAKKR